MDDQFGGRTDDDLFYDDFEPVESETVIISEQPPVTPAPTRSPAPVPVSRPQKSPSKPVQGLSSSRFADSPEPPEQTISPVDAPAEPAEAAPPAASGPPSDAPTAPKKHQKGNGRNHKNHEYRAGSGANPRQKLTEDELSAKMQHMKLLNAEKERKFERASQDEKQHAESYARGMEEARKRRKEAEERRKRTEETQRKLNDEREKNRERKLKAMGAKEGGSWDEGKVEQLEEERRRGFKGANGGVRGTRRGGLGNSRFAEDDAPDVDRFLEERSRGRGRGRGGRGRGGRGGRDSPANERAPTKPQAVPTTEDFPALSTSSIKEPEKVTAAVSPAYEPGKGVAWDEEMEALDAEKKKY
ncbi:uncharacterized protein F5Z01DRAFT_486129 [Emericellopsis atlantica]|uniref:Uncharacterized protein n=1 Tax=Emericellopsis atlantica TaxID=2614577 RepID=A0A9P7ZR13_9HYPO|nr:uncharacterized protein F5Z01DRAFT_486129 [Emericellopsis atlantica]KAG9256734.1 hypothetical protein F5Z01DRAFT_486129 [Emericellopsis atlantica]